MSAFNAVLPVLTLLLGVGLSYLTEGRRYKRARRDNATDSLREQRGEAYRSFMKDVHLTAHIIGRATPGCPHPLSDPAEAHAAVDRDVARDLFELELFASTATLAAARQLRQSLTEFRETVISNVMYMDDAYRAALGRYQQSRTAFLATARGELMSN
ncbi:MAG: hypothetical protein ABI662_08270 [Dermatophilaceae bacterium]